MTEWTEYRLIELMDNILSGDLFLVFSKRCAKI